MVYNYPPFIFGKKQNAHVRLDFGNKDNAYKFYKQHFMDKVSGKTKDDIRSKLIVVAGRWEKRQ